VKKRKNVYYI